MARQASLPLPLNRLVGQLNTARRRAQGIGVGTLAYAVAGEDGTLTALNATESYDGTTNVWTTRGNKTTAAWGFGLSVISPNTLFVASGGVSTAGIALVDSNVFDTAPKTWAAGNPLGTARADSPTVLRDDNKLVIAGGFTGAGASVLATAELRTGGGAGTWAATGSLFQKRAGHTLTAIGGGKVLAVGGYTGIGPAGPGVQALGLYTPLAPTSIVEVLTTATGLWTILGNSLIPRYGHGAIKISADHVLVFGGYASSGGSNPAPMASCEIYHIGSNTWTPAAPMPIGQAEAAYCLTATGDLLVCGGDAAGTAAAVYNPGSNTWTNVGPLDGVASFAVRLPDGDIVVGSAGSYALVASTLAGLFNEPSAGVAQSSGWSSQGTGSTINTEQLVGPRSASMPGLPLFAGTVEIDGSADGVLWFPLITFNGPAGAPLQVIVGGFNFARAVCSGYTGSTGSLKIQVAGDVFEGIS